MTRVKIGDIIEIQTPKGLAYAQYTHKHPEFGALIRVFGDLHAVRPNDFARVVRGNVQFLCFFILQAAVNQDIVAVVGNVPVPADAARFPLFRDGFEDSVTGKVAEWRLWDGEKEWRIGSLTNEQRSLPLRRIWNDTLLIERIASGYRAENDPST